MSGINLLPEDQRAKDLEAKAEAAAVKKPASGFSRATAGSGVASGSGQGWQRFIKALKDNLGKSTSASQIKPHTVAPAQVTAPKPQPTPTSAPVAGVFDVKTINVQKPVSPVVPLPSQAKPVSATPVPPPPPQAPVVPTTPQKSPENLIKPAPTLPETGTRPLPHIPSFKRTSGAQGVTLPDVNLIPSSERFVAPARKQIILGSIAVAAFALVGLLYAGLQWSISVERNKFNLANTKAEQGQVEINLLETQAEQIISSRYRMTAMQQILEKKTTWYNFFTFLQSVTAQNVSYASLAGDYGGKVTLTGEAPSYTDVARQLLALEQSPDVLAVDLTGLTPVVKEGEGTKQKITIGFTLLVTLKPSLFVK